MAVDSHRLRGLGFGADRQGEGARPARGENQASEFGLDANGSRLQVHIM